MINNKTDMPNASAGIKLLKISRPIVYDAQKKNNKIL